METLNNTEKSGYGSRLGMICILISGSVGTGNMWRYPRLVCTYGGAFIIATVVGLLLIAIPLCMNENFMGRASRHSAPGAFRDLLGPKFTWMGTFATLCYFMMHCNYTVILAWCVRYTFMSAGGTYFGVEDKMALFNSVASRDVFTGICWVGIVALAWIFASRQSMLEKGAKFIVPAMAVILFIMIGFAATREGGVEGLKYSYSFTAGELVDPNIWLQAITQDFWSLGSGTMLCVTMAKFARKDEDIVVNTKIQGFGDASFAQLATLAVLPCIPGTEFVVPCDTVLLSVGLIPGNEVSKSAGVQLDPITKGPIVDNTMETSVPGIFACGNVVHVNDLVDNVSRESEIAGASAAVFSDKGESADKKKVSPGNLVRYVVPQYVNSQVNSDVKMYFRVTEPLKNVTIQAKAGDEVIYKKKKQFVNPGEMEQISVEADKLNAMQNAGITVSVEKNEEA